MIRTGLAMLALVAIATATSRFERARPAGVTGTVDDPGRSASRRGLATATRAAPARPLIQAAIAVGGVRPGCGR